LIFYVVVHRAEMKTSMLSSPPSSTSLPFPGFFIILQLSRAFNERIFQTRMVRTAKDKLLQKGGKSYKTRSLPEQRTPRSLIIDNAVLGNFLLNRARSGKILPMT
jgi:hypothetical protein